MNEYKCVYCGKTMRQVVAGSLSGKPVDCKRGHTHNYERVGPPKPTDDGDKNELEGVR